ncbi:OLC1v1034376C1 [Oldenlandia corymbosa var. corymbosa]|uniref:HECT-type E3 ubiquitin transferase n=1 Tax=Oldenlandia corymbosa var. corymbosa TaxID=529605 RepID=A0AAV1CRR5_OLDCO|nr:OLC1v1034376C1 [Oldenlandia corymbosa var. corymbosa]
MEESRKHQVSLRGASAKELSREELIQKVSQQRELRNHIRRATAAALLIQRIWRGHNAIKVAALQLQREWFTLMNQEVMSRDKLQIVCIVLRPFIFFMTSLSSRSRKFQSREVDCMKLCFKVLLESINSTDPSKNFCSLVVGSSEERRIWKHQSKKLISLCLHSLLEFDYSMSRVHDTSTISLAMRLAVVLTDRKAWKSITDSDIQDADTALKNLTWFLGSKESGAYNIIRRYIIQLPPSIPSQGTSLGTTDDGFLITASVLTVALRPFHVTEVTANDSGVHCAAEGYCISLLTIPWFSQRLPAVLLPALRHKSVLSYCLRRMLMSKDRVLKDLSDMDQLETNLYAMEMPNVAWALANIVFLATGLDSNGLGSAKFCLGLDVVSYVNVVVLLAENLLSRFEKDKAMSLGKRETGDIDNQADFIGKESHESEAIHESLKMSYTDLLRPVCQPCHLMELVNLEGNISAQNTDNLSHHSTIWKVGLLDVVYYYSSILRVFSVLNPMAGALPVLNMLSFTPGFLSKLWDALEKSPFKNQIPIANLSGNITSRGKSGLPSDRKQKKFAKEGGSRWVNAMHKFSGNSITKSSHTDSAEDSSLGRLADQSPGVWNVEMLRSGPVGLSKDVYCLLHLFCATYSHLLLVMDDIEFYEKQVPFELEQQRKIALVLNTLVYNGVSHNLSPDNKPLMDSAIRCLHLLYERDCRHQYCPPALWLSPGEGNRPPVAVAVRTHEVMCAAVKEDNTSSSSIITSVITIIPHVFPFEERVEMFRELVNINKASRRMAGEAVGPGPGSTEIVIRRDHIVEDGFRQLNVLGPRLKSNIHVSFVSESGLAEAGLDYGGLSKEFLTDIAKAMFSPEYGLFCQSSTSDRLLIPNTAARFLENGIQMIEFLGRVVGKALYEGILLDYSFSHVFVQKLLGRYSFLDELSTLDPELYRNLMYVKLYEGDIKDLSLDFTVTEEALGKRQVIELKPGGKDVAVTNENKLQYIHAIADYKLNRQILPFSNAFYRGLTDLISPSWLRLFNANEFNQLLSGGSHDIDVDDLRKNTKYTGGYNEGSRTVKLFWEVVAGLEPKQRCMLLKFVTSCSRGPLLGFKHLQPSFTIHKVACDVPLWATFGGRDVDRLPSASTCYNTLKLPTYKRFGTLREKLLYAINSNAGFELS